MTPPIDIPAAQAICDAATPGPWTCEEHDHGWTLLSPWRPPLWAPGLYKIFGTDSVYSHGPGISSATDMAFICLARTALPAALHELAQLRRERDEWRQLALAARGREGHLEERTAEAIAAWLVMQHRHGIGEGLNDIAKEIRAGAWRKP